ncbi:MAG: 2-C-methyl-D-erythritol 4-phosphate cytidylyltransferase [Oscillospiraceae bacterium]|nr:2-C-methyl-D-erythritol 4-phosphate cytidylyltransferase [Oscillospiraceae bacterium]
MKMPSVIMPYCAAVVPAAGSSSRMNGVDKIFYRLGGDPVIVRTLRVLSACEYIGEIVLLVREDSVTRAAALMNAYGLDKVTVNVSGSTPTLETVTKSYTPSETAQSETITPGAGYDGIGEVDVSVGAISSTYVGTGITRRDSTDLSASGATVTVPAGYYENAASKAVSSGSATPAASISATGATVTPGTNTLQLSKTNVSSTPQVSAGYISSGTAGNSTVTLTANVTTKAAATITPGTSNQTIASGTYLTGTQTISGDANLVAGNIKSGTTIFGVTGSYTGGGSSNWTLLGTKSLGTISTSSTTDTDTGQTIVVTGWNDYDLLVCECSVDTKTNGRHAASTKTAWLTASSNVTTKNGCTFATACWNCKLSSSGTATTRSSTTSYGVYAKAGTISGTNLTITIYQRYNSTQTGTINGSYTMRVYGCKIYDLIGG